MLRIAHEPNNVDLSYNHSVICEGSWLVTARGPCRASELGMNYRLLISSSPAWTKSALSYYSGQYSDDERESELDR